MNDFPVDIPTWTAGQWGYTTFQTRDEFRDFVLSLFVESGPYEIDPEQEDVWYHFDETTEVFNEYARKFTRGGHYIAAPKGTKDYREFWRRMKERCRKGVIFHNGRGNTWYLPGFYYHWVNFLKIYNKELDRQTFPDILDAQYHMALYETLAVLFYMHVVIFKKRQFAFSYFHAALIYNRYILNIGFIGKMGASDKKYIDDTGTWKFLAEYRDFTLEHTGWYRPNFPEKPLNWKQQQSIKTADGKNLYKGTKSKITGHTFDKSPTAGVGGATSIFYYEEAGIAPTLAKTYGYMKPAMEYGMITTGLFIAGGSVGELAAAQDLHKFLMNPVANGFYPVKTNLLDKNGTIGQTGLVIPEQWSMPPCIDRYGNTQNKRALKMLGDKFKQMEQTMDPADYQLYVSQHPRNIEEGFAIRTLSIFPVKHTTKQIKRIEDKEYFIEYGELDRTDTEQLVWKKFGASDRKPIDEFPLSMRTEDKRGAVCIHEHPVRDQKGHIEWGTYYAGIDPVEGGKTTTSSSLASIYVYRNDTEVIRTDAQGKSTVSIDPGKIVAWWCGRYDDSNETNEQLRRIVEYYNAWTIVENNKPGFITYMIANKQQHRLAGKDDMLFVKDLGITQNVYNPYGFSTSATLWKGMLEYGVDFLSEELDRQENPDGTTRKIIYGVTRIPDIMLLKEMQAYQDKGNYDRIIAYCALIAFVKVQEAARGKRKRIEKVEEELTDVKKISRNLGVDRQIFHNIGTGRQQTSTGRSRNVFRNLR